MDPRTTQIIKRLKKFKKENKLQRLILFGSRYTGAYTKYSDVDLIVVSPRFRNLKSFQRAPLLRLKWNLEHPVDMLCYTPEEFERKKTLPTIVREAVQHGIKI